MKKIKKYMVGKDSEVFAISLVDAPAVESEMVFLSKENEKTVFLKNEEKHMVYSCALRPDFPIYRYDQDTETEFYIEFSKDSVEQLSRKFLKDGFQSQWTVDHTFQVEGISLVESWIKTDMEHDKSIALGLDKELPIGTWFVGCYVENQEIWDMVKNGDFHGFSVEANVQLNELNFSKDNMELEKVEVNDSFWAKLVSVIKEALNIEPKEVENTDEKAEEIVEEVKEEIEIVEEPKEEEVKAEKQDDEQPTEDEPQEDIVEEVVEQVVGVVEEVSEEPKEDLQAIIDGLNEKINELNEEIEELKAENVRLSKQPSTKPLKTNLSSNDTRSPFERMLNVLESNK